MLVLCYYSYTNERLKKFNASVMLNVEKPEHVIPAFEHKMATLVEERKPVKKPDGTVIYPTDLHIPYHAKLESYAPRCGKEVW